MGETGAKGTSYIPSCSLTGGGGGDSLRWTSTSSYPTFSPFPRATLVEVGLWVSPLTLSFPYALLAEVGITLGRVVVSNTFPYDSLVEVWILALDLDLRLWSSVTPPTGMYHCDIATTDHNEITQKRVYVGLYANGGGLY